MTELEQEIYEALLPLIPEIEERARVALMETPARWFMCPFHSLGMNIDKAIFDNEKDRVVAVEYRIGISGGCKIGDIYMFDEVEKRRFYIPR